MNYDIFTQTPNKIPSHANGLKTEVQPPGKKRLGSIDLLRGTVMIIMALDHVRDYFHKSAFLYDPTDLNQSSVVLFFTRWITHYCAPVFVFLAGISAYLYGVNKTRKELSIFLFKRGIWLVFAEMFVIGLGWSLNPSFHVFNLQVIWAIGICMILLSALIYLNLNLILSIGLILIGGHNLLDQVHVPGHGGIAFLWALLHQPGDFVFGHYTFFARYPVLPWVGIMATGYYAGSLYSKTYDPEKRRRTLLSIGMGSIILFILLRFANGYGDPSPWSVQKNSLFSLMSFLNVTKYPPSLLYTLMTLGPAMVFLSLAERPLNALATKITVFGRVPMFYYLVHIYLIHGLAIVGAMISGFKWSNMVMLSNRVNRVPELKGYGFNLITVYLVWIAVVLILYPCCKWYDRYKRAHQSTQWWLTYI